MRPTSAREMSRRGRGRWLAGFLMLAATGTLWAAGERLTITVQAGPAATTTPASNVYLGTFNFTLNKNATRSDMTAATLTHYGTAAAGTITNVRFMQDSDANPGNGGLTQYGATVASLTGGSAAFSDPAPSVVWVGTGQLTTYAHVYADIAAGAAGSTVGFRLASSAWSQSYSDQTAYPVQLGTTSVQAANTPPTVTITAPTNGSNFNEGVSVNFTGTATDAEQGNIAGSLAWTSSLNGAIGSGASFSSSTLSVGTHTITASVTDGGGLSDSDAITLTINNVTPTVTITAPANASSFSFGTNVTFSGTATDPNNGSIAASLAWTSSRDGAIGSGAAFSTTTLSVGTHTITASVADPDGGPNGQHQITVTITASNTPPTATITAPTNGSSFNEGVSVNFTGTATDPQEGNIAANLAWTSSLDGALGSGASLSISTLSVGVHTITASVTDGGGLSDSDAITLTIDNVTPTVTITAPADLATLHQGANVSFTGTATDPNDGSIAASLAWTSSLDGAIGSGASFSISTLSVGTHTITAQVLDPDDGVTTAQDEISITINARPVVTILAPTNGADFLIGTSVAFTGTATDAEDGDRTSSLSWTSSLQGLLGSGGSFSRSDLSLGTHVVTASATDGDGATGQAQVTITVSPPGNTAPTVSITSPADSAVFNAGQTVNFAGSATDAEDGDRTASLSWTSSLQGLLGSGASFSRSDLAVGTHVVTASATDSVGATGQSLVTITVNAPAAVNATTAGTATAEASTCSQITVVARFSGDDDRDGSSTFTIAPSGSGCATVQGASPRRCIISELTPGAYTLSVSFADPDGVAGSPVTPTGSPVTVPACSGTDDEAPMLLVLAPMRDAVVSGTERAKIQVYDPGLSTVQWMVDSANDLDLASATVNANYDCGTDCAVYEFDLVTSGLSLGAHYFTVKAADAEGNVGRITRAFRVPTSPGDGRLLRRTPGSQLCIDCHNLKTHSSQTTDSSYGNWAIECVDCHTPHQTSNIYLIRGEIDTPNSGRRSVRFESRYGARQNTKDLPGQASFVNEDAGEAGSPAAVDGPCQVCHTRTKSGGGTERWRNSSQTPSNADNHFDDGRPTQTCTNCHSHDAGFSGVGGACNACHVAPPDVGKHRLHDEVWDSTAGNLPTAYNEDTTHATPTEYGFACAECHSNDNADHFPVEGAPYTVDVLFKGTAPPNPGGLYDDDGGSRVEDPGVNGSGWYWSNGTCSSLYCHSNGSPTGGGTATTASVTWDQATAVTCVSCHDTQARTDSGSAADLSAAHGKHIQSSLGESGSYAFKCDECHALTIRDNPNNPWELLRSADFSTVTGRGKRQHVDGEKDVAFSATATAADNVDQSGGGYAGAGGSCSNTYCHSKGTTTSPAFAMPFANLDWVGGSANCASCHGGNAAVANKIWSSGVTNAHQAHMDQASYLGKNLECAQCHDDTLDLASDTTITALGFHVNGARDININKGGTYVALSASCSNVYCHSKGTEDLVAGTSDYLNPPAWNSGSTLANTCKSCHGTEAGSIAGEPRYANNQGAFKTRNTHPKHVTAATDCVKCHSGTVNGSGGLLAVGAHLNQQRDVTVAGYILSYSEGTETCTNQCHGGAGNPVTWGGNALVCLDCHSGTEGGALGDGAPNAVDDQWTTMGANSAGHGHASYGNFASTGGANPSAYGGCDYCHDLGTAHTPTVGTNPYRLRFSATDNQLCLQCHSTNDTGISANSQGATLNTVDSSKDVDTAHFGTKHQTGEGGSLCWDCHDPHGVPSNILMMKSQVSRNSNSYGVPATTVTVNFTDKTTAGQAPGRFTEATNTPRTGMCQACHAIKAGDPLLDPTASTKYWRNDGTDYNTGAGNSIHNAAALCTTCHFHDKDFKGAGGDCLACHSSAGQAGTTGANSRRPVLADFGRQSHHVGASVDAAGAALYAQPTMGGALTNYDCVVCHAEGMLVDDAQSNGQCTGSGAPYACCTGSGTGTCKATDTTGQPHQDGIIHLRNADSATTYFAYNKDQTNGIQSGAPTPGTWNSGTQTWREWTSGVEEAGGAALPAPSGDLLGAGLDRFCLSCHDSNGALSSFNSGASEKRGFTGSNLNPFADSAVTNEVDRLTRPGPVDIAGMVAAGSCASYPGVYCRQNADCPGGTTCNVNTANETGTPRGANAIPDPPDGIYSRHAIRGKSASVYTTATSALDTTKACEVYAIGNACTVNADCKQGGNTGTCTGIRYWEQSKYAWNSISVMGCADCHTTDGANTTSGNAHGSGSEYLLKDASGTAVEGTASGGNYNCYLCHRSIVYTNYAFHTGSSSNDIDTTAATGSTNRTAGDGGVFGMACINCHGGAPGNEGTHQAPTTPEAASKGFGRIHGTSAILSVGTGTGTRQAYRFMNGGGLRFYDPGTWSTASVTCYTLGGANGGADTWSSCAHHNSGTGFSKPVTRTLNY